MRTLCVFVAAILFAALPTVAHAQKYVYDVNRTELGDEMLYRDIRQIINLPSVNGLVPLKCDFHIHTVFTDADVWPTARVNEAWRQGLDVIAITDHLRAVPIKPNVVGGPNTPYELAAPHAMARDLLLIHGTELSYAKPAGGHLGALFIQDAEKMLNLSPENAIKEAVRQGGIVIWNHPGWNYDTCKMFPINKQFIESGHIKAVEVFNGYEGEWYPRALTWCRDFKLAPVAATDIHDLAGSFYNLSDKKLRPMTIVLAREKTEAAVKEAIETRNTIAFYSGMIAGEKQLLADFFNAAVKIRKFHAAVLRGKMQYYYIMANPYDVPFVLEFEDGKKQTLRPGTETFLFRASDITELKVKVINAHTCEFETLNITIPLPR